MFEPLNSIRSLKLPNGILSLLFEKADGHEAPMKLLVDGETKYNIVYRDSSGTKQTLSEVTVESAKMSDDSEVDKYILHLDEGIYKDLPDVVRYDERDNFLDLILVVPGESSITVEAVCTVGSLEGLSVDVDQYLSKGGENNLTFIYSTTNDKWKIDEVDVEIEQYGISWESGEPANGDTIQTTVTSTPSSEEIPVCNILSVEKV